MKGPFTKEEVYRVIANEQETKLARAKRILAVSLTSRMCNQTTYEEAKASCVARKRKERQESVSSISQERKVIRSSSEERPVKSKSEQSEIRRVSSHEDVIKQNKDEASIDNLLIHHDNRTLIYDDDDEHEQRRSYERFSRPLAPRGRRVNQAKKPKIRQFSKLKYKSELNKENTAYKHIAKSDKPETVVNTNTDRVEQNAVETTKPNLDHFLQLHREEKQRTPSPEPVATSPTIDLTTLHEQIDSMEPVPSNTSRTISEETETLPSALVASSRLLLSPRNSIIATHRIYLDPDVPQTNSSLKKSRNPVEQRLKNLSKQINFLKKNIKKHEEEYEAHFGYRPSHADKLNDKNIKKLYGELNQTRKEYKQLKENSPAIIFEASPEKRCGNPPAVSGVKLQDTLLEIEKRLNNRSSAQEVLLDQMNHEQLMEEKVAMQKALLFLESLHGRPSNREDRDLVRPLYDKYRTLKRMIAKTQLSNSSINELATIHENETMDFVSSTATQITETDSERTPYAGASTDSDTDNSVSENLHSLTREELVKQQKLTLEEKKDLRRSLQQFEVDFQSRTGRKVQKDDKVAMEHVYASYKKTKAKLRLLEALLNKEAP